MSSHGRNMPRVTQLRRMTNMLMRSNQVPGVKEIARARAEGVTHASTSQPQVFETQPGVMGGPWPTLVISPL
jgi:hypothetical protein